MIWFLLVFIGFLKLRFVVCGLWFLMLLVGFDLCIIKDVVLLFATAQGIRSMYRDKVIIWRLRGALSIFNWFCRCARPDFVLTST